MCVPLTADQPLNARRCANLGAAIAIDPTELTMDGLNDAVHTVWATPRFRGAARRVQAENDAQPGLAHAIDLLERLARDREPVLANWAD